MAYCKTLSNGRRLIIEQQEIKVYINKEKRRYASLSIQGKSLDLHTVLAEVFLGHKPNGSKGLYVDHINNDQFDNRLENLQLVTHSVNMRKDFRMYSVMKNGGGVYVPTVKFSKLGDRFNLGNFRTRKVAMAYAMWCYENKCTNRINRARKKSVYYKGKKYNSLKELSDEKGIGYTTVVDRIKRMGMSITEAIDTPLKRVSK